MVLLVPAVLQLLLLLAEAQPSVSAAERWANVLESAAEPTAAHTGGAQSLRLAEQLEGRVAAQTGGRRECTMAGGGCLARSRAPPPPQARRPRRPGPTVRVRVRRAVRAQPWRPGHLISYNTRVRTRASCKLAAAAVAIAPSLQARARRRVGRPICCAAAAAAAGRASVTA